jgi:mannosyltransferase OCH1-like enzyme
MKVKTIHQIREARQKKEAENQKLQKILPVLKEEIDKHREIKHYMSLMKPFEFPSTSIIPCHLYTCWHTKELPPLMQQNFDTIVRENPEMQVNLYDENECRQFIEQYFDTSIVQAYDALIPCSYKADLWRFCILYIHGGIYMDIKYKPMNGFRLIGLTDKEYFVRDADPTNVYTALIVTMTKNEKLLRCIHQIVENVKTKFYGSCPLSPTGPKLLGTFFTPNEKKDMILYHDYKDHLNIFYIVYQDRIILEFYEHYREEQKQYQKKKRYIDLWNEKTIYM